MCTGVKSAGRYAKICPVPGCRSKPQKKLSQHISYKHPDLLHRKKELLAMARRYEDTIPKRRKTPLVCPSQPTLKEFVGSTPSSGGTEDGTAGVGSSMACAEREQPDDGGGEDREVTDDDSTAVEQPSTEDDGLRVQLGKSEGGTRNFPKFNTAHPSFWRFETYLTGIDGGSRSEKTAKEMSVDVSKFLKYACGRACVHPDWMRLVDRDQLVGYIEKLRSANVGPEGQLAKLDAFFCALRFLKVVVVADCNDPSHAEVVKMEETIAGWKATLRKQKGKLRKRRLQDLSCEQLSLDEVTALLNCKLLWSHINDVYLAAERMKPIPANSLDMCAVALAGSILFKNWQRPGAVCNATLREYETAKVMNQEVGKPLVVMSVERHKTSMEGFAKLVLEPLDHARLGQYIHLVRPLQDTQGKSNHLFLLSGSRPITKLSTKLKSLGVKYGLSLPTASRVRKIGATAVALNLGDSTKAHLVTRNMSHSVNTSAQYYQAIVGDSHAATAFETMSQLREDGSEVDAKSSESPLLTPRKAQRRHAYSEKESNAVAKYFASHVEQGIPASLAECKEFLLVNEMARTPKNIQDKVRALFK